MGGRYVAVCGICGILSGKYERPNEESILSMFAETESRGRDAAGFASSVRGKLWLYKAPRPSSSIVANLKEFKMREARAWVAHARLATHGTEKKNTNNHPFVREGLALIHNGIVSNYDSLIFKNGLKELEGDCDSELILATILKYRARLGVTGAIKQMATELSGAMACALINRPGELWLWHREYSTRWSMTPLEIAVSTTTPNLHFASTKKCLEMSLNPRLAWDIGNLDSGKGLHISIVKNKLNIRNFDVPDCKDKTYSRYNWNYEYNWENQYSKWNPMQRSIWCDTCSTFFVGGHDCENIRRLKEESLEGEKNKIVLNPEEDALYYCETNNCNTLLTWGEVIPHRNNTGHKIYRKELM